MELEKKLCKIMTVGEKQFGFMPERRTVDAVFILRRLLEEYHAKGRKLCMCFVDIEILFLRVDIEILTVTKESV